jgi:hypothetical protein
METKDRGDTMETGDIVFVRGNTWISKLIRFFDKGKFSHVALAVSTERITEAQYKTTVKVKPLDYESYEVFPMSLSEEQKRQLLDSIRKYEGKRYDYFLAFSMATKWLRLDNPNYLMCTELVMKVLQDIGVLAPHLEKMPPNEFYKYMKEKHPTI